MTHAPVSILVVEDDPIIRFTLSKTLMKHFDHIDTAENGSIGLHKIHENKYDMIISDLSMPVMDGYQMIKEIRESGNQTPIIICSAYEFDDQDKYNCTLLTKPVVMKQLIDLISQHIT